MAGRKEEETSRGEREEMLRTVTGFVGRRRRLLDAGGDGQGGPAWGGLAAGSGVAPPVSEGYAIFSNRSIFFFTVKK